MCARLPDKQEVMRLIKRRSRDGRTGVRDWLRCPLPFILRTGRTGVARVSGGVVELPLHFVVTFR